MKTKIFLSSVLTIALCLSLIVGSTFALFETKQEVNIAVTAGKVDVSAVIPGDKLTAELFAGEANYDSTKNELIITTMVPGDKVSFEIEVANNSNIPIQYKVGASSSSTSEKNLLGALKCTVTVPRQQQPYVMTPTDSGFETGYFYVDAPENVGDKLTTIKVELEFPKDGDHNAYQGANASIVFTISAVQGNGDTTNP